MPKNTPIRIIDNAPRRAASFLGGGGNTSINDHGLLGGLNDDDHIFYHNDARGDVRYVPLGRTVTAGDGLSGGGALSANLTLSLASTAAGNGLTYTTGVLGVGVSGLGLGVGADAITLTSSSNPGAAAAVLASASDGSLTLTTLTASTKVRAPLLDTASGNLALQPAADVTLSPGSNIVRLGSGKLVQSNSFTSGFAGAGWRVDDGLTEAGKTSLEVDNLTVRGLLRVYELLISKIRTGNGSYLFSDGGKVASVTGTNPYTLTFDEDHGFAANDLIRAQKFLGTTYTSSCTVDNTPTTKTAVVWLVGGTAPLAGYEFVRIGNSSNTSRRGSVYVTSNDSGAPFLDVIDGIAAHSDWNTAGKVRVRLGQLNGILGESLYGLFVGNSAGLWVGGDATYGFRVVYGSVPRLTADASGNLNLYNSAGTATITLDASGASYFAGPMTIGASGGIYQGSGSFPSPTTGLKIWSDSSIGRIAGYNGGTLQWGAGTDGKLTAGADNVQLSSDGVRLLATSVAPDTTPRSILWSETLPNTDPTGEIYSWATTFNEIAVLAKNKSTTRGSRGRFGSTVSGTLTAGLRSTSAYSGGVWGHSVDIYGNTTFADNVSITGTTAFLGRVSTDVPVRQHTTDNAWSIDASGGSTVTATAGAVFQFSDDSTFSGLVIVTNNTDGGVGLFTCGGGVVVKVADGNSVYSVTKDTSSKNNLYYDAGSNEYRLQNSNATSRTYQIFSVRMRASS